MNENHIVPGALHRYAFRRCNAAFVERGLSSGSTPCWEEAGYVPLASNSVAHRIMQPLGIIREFGKFGTVGIGGIVINFAVFNLAVGVGDIAAIKASVIGTVTAIAANYFGYRLWVYRKHAGIVPLAQQTSSYALLSVVGLIIENGTLFITHDWLGWDGRLADNIFKLVGLGSATLFRFLSYRTWVFRASASSSPEGRHQSVFE